MIVCAVRDATLSYFIEHIKPSLKKVDLVLFSFKTIKKIDYESEVLNDTQFIKTFLQLSKQLNCVVLVGSYFELLGETLASILVCERGELLGITDSLSSSKKDKIKEIKLFVTKLGSIGVLVNEDLLSEKLRSLMHKFEPRLIINIASEIDMKTWNETLQKQNAIFNDNLISLTNTALFYKEQESNEIKLNFCEFFTKEFKM